MLTPARRIGISLAAAAAIASGGCILFWIGGFLSFFVVEWFRSDGSGFIGAVSFGFSGSAVLLLAALPICILLNSRLRTWARSTPGSGLRLHRLHGRALWTFFILVTLAAALMLAGGNNIVVFATFGIVVTAMLAYGLQFLLLGVLLGLYAAAPDPDAAHP